MLRPQSSVSCLVRLVFAKGTWPQWLMCWLCCLEWEEGGSVLELPRKIIRLDLNNTRTEKGGVRATLPLTIPSVIVHAESVARLYSHKGNGSSLAAIFFQ